MLDGFLFDLDAESKLIRLSAIMHLQRFSQHSDVLEALKRRFEAEADDELRYHLQTIIDPRKLFTVGRASAIAEPEAFDVSTPEALTSAWFSAPVERLPVLLKALRSFSAPTIERLLREWFLHGLDQSRLQLLLDLEPSPFVGPLAGELVKPLLLDRRPVIVLKALWHLSRNAPGETLEHLPHLLISPSIPVRVLALRTLHRLWPAEALRLLEEFLADPDPALRSIGLAMLFQFPFEDIAFIVLRLLEIPDLPRTGLDVLLVLVRSNPDRGFLQRLTALSLTRGDDLPALAEVLTAAATALTVAGLERGTADEVIARSSTAAGKRLEAVVPPPKPPAKAVAEPSAPAMSELERVQIALDKNVCDEETRRLLQLLVERATLASELGRVVSRAILTFSLREPLFLGWLERRLEDADEQLALGAVVALEKLDPRRLAAHLPVLCFHRSPRVLFQAVRALRKREGTTFLRRIQAWLKDRDPRAMQAAVAGLMQIDFDRARSLILQTIRSAASPELGEALGRILIMNPEPRTIWELETMAEELPKRRDSLLALATACRTAIGEISGPGGGEVGSRNPLQKTLEEWRLDERARFWLERIRAIRYRTPEWEMDAGTGRRVAGLVFAIVAALLGLGTLVGSGDGLAVPRRGGIAPKVFKRVNEAVSLPTGQPVSIKLEEYDPLGRQWKVSTANGGIAKIRFQAGISGLQAGMRGLVELTPAGTSPLGYALFTAGSWRPLGTP